jgi:hypothetical protein
VNVIRSDLVTMGINVTEVESTILKVENAQKGMLYFN